MRVRIYLIYICIRPFFMESDVPISLGEEYPAIVSRIVEAQVRRIVWELHPEAKNSPAILIFNRKREIHARIQTHSCASIVIKINSYFCNKEQLWHMMSYALIKMSKNAKLPYLCSNLDKWDRPKKDNCLLIQITNFHLHTNLFKHNLVEIRRVQGRNCT